MDDSLERDITSSEGPTVPWVMIARDLMLLLATPPIWGWSRSLDANHSPLATPVGVLAGVLAATAAFFLHEWGHLLAALAVKSRVSYPTTWRSIFLFKFDAGNDRKQFLTMAAGGFLASAIGIVAMLFLLSFHALADWVAIGISILGVIATIVLEVPPTWRVGRGANPPRDYVKLP